MKLLGSYTNGNYNVRIYDDGTKVRETDADMFQAQFPESMDVKITNQCDMGCPYCHENSSVDGLHGDILNFNFIDTLRPYTEMAIGGGNPLSHPQVVDFLKKLKDRNIIANMTVNQKHFMDNIALIRRLADEKLIYGLGVSFNSYTEDFVETISQFPNAVLHVINGVISTSDLRKMLGRGLKILILGYKQFRRGNEYYSEFVERQKADMYAALPEVLKGFRVVSFDNLALKQLAVERLLTKEEWNEFYQGDDGSHTMYVDLVNQRFALNSTSVNTFDLLDTVDEMFAVLATKRKDGN